ncbi:MAG: RNA pseudouridine synthase [Bacteroidetes bacterium]|nr:RNA pseudouridine synthase [Bacteroidota bacterium]
MATGELEIIFEDNHLIAVNKKPGDIVQGDKTGDEPLSEKVKKYIKDKYDKPGDVFLGTIHRIDRPVSGVVLFARTSKALERMNEQFREREVKKIYWAVVKNSPPDQQGILVNYLIKDEIKNKSRAYDAPKGKALKCELEYKLISKSDRYSLLEINPLTGRHHQIRVQLSKIGCPIKGDLKYGFDRSNPDGSIHLHARRIAFNHPVTKESIIITAPPPNESLWNFFKTNIG